MLRFHEISRFSLQLIPERMIQRQYLERSFHYSIYSRKALCDHLFKQLWVRPCISMPLQSKFLQDWTTAGHFHVMLLLRLFGVKSVWASVFLMQQSQWYFSPFSDTINKFFFMSQFYFLRQISWVRYTRQKKSLYLHNRAPPSSNNR